jgi:uncharacterized protein
VIRAIGYLLCVWNLTLSLGAGAQNTGIPFLSGRVVDEAEILSAPARERLSAMSKAHERTTSDQVAVLTVASIRSEAIEEYAARVFESWKLGVQGKNNGVLIVVVSKDHKMRIEVGDGLKDVLTHVQASRIVRDLMAPRFREGNYDVGMEAGITAVIQILEGRHPTENEWVQARTKTVLLPDSASTSLVGRILFTLLFLAVIGLFTAIALVTPGGLGWFLYLFLMPFWFIFPVGAYGDEVGLWVFVGYLGVFLILKSYFSQQAWYRKMKADMKIKGRSGIGGMVIGAGGSSDIFSSRAGFSSGDGISGGSGGPGGGGASGSW